MPSRITKHSAQLWIWTCPRHLVIPASHTCLGGRSSARGFGMTNRYEAQLPSMIAPMAQLAMASGRLRKSQPGNALQQGLGDLLLTVKTIGTGWIRRSSLTSGASGSSCGSRDFKPGTSRQVLAAKGWHCRLGYRRALGEWLAAGSSNLREPADGRMGSRCTASTSL